MMSERTLVSTKLPLAQHSETLKFSCSLAISNNQLAILQSRSVYYDPVDTFNKCICKVIHPVSAAHIGEIQSNIALSHGFFWTRL